MVTYLQHGYKVYIYILTGTNLFMCDTVDLLQVTCPNGITSLIMLQLGILVCSGDSGELPYRSWSVHQIVRLVILSVGSIYLHSFGKMPHSAFISHYNYPILATYSHFTHLRLLAPYTQSRALTPSP